MADYRLSQIIKEYIVETLGDEQLNRYKRFFYLGTSFLRENAYDMSGSLISVELPINNNDTVDLPSDYLNYSKIGICAGGIVYSLGRNDSICLDKSYNVCGVPVRDLPDTNVIINGQVGVTPTYYGEHFRNGELMGKFFGIGGGNNTNGYYRIDKSSNQLRLNGVNFMVTSIMLEYIADLSSVDGDFLVNPFLIESLKAWVFWKSIQRDRNRSLGEKQLAEADYNKAITRARKRFDSSTISEWSEAVRSGNKASPKF